MSTPEKPVALVTGGGSGIGAAIARRFAQDGGRVALVGRRQAPLEGVAVSIREAGGLALVLAHDITAAGAGESLVQAVVEKWGRLDRLVLNAATYRPQPVLETSRAGWEEHFRTNVHASFSLARAAHDALAASGGVVLSILTNLADRPVPGAAAYASSKAALLSLHQSLALEWAPEGIRAVAISPGVVDTPLHDEGTLDRMAGAHPLGRCGSPADIAAAAAFLCGPESHWTTGAVLHVDGGIHLA